MQTRDGFKGGHWGQPRPPLNINWEIKKKPLMTSMKLNLRTPSTQREGINKFYDGNQVDDKITWGLSGGFSCLQSRFVC